MNFDGADHWTCHHLTFSGKKPCDKHRVEIVRHAFQCRDTVNKLSILAWASFNKKYLQLCGQVLLKNV